jgi:hypothetical protein
MRKQIEPTLGQGLEHVSVLFEDRRGDMFVGENSAATEAYNEEATKIYHAASIARGEDVSDAPVVYGVAVVASRRIWF